MTPTPASTQSTTTQSTVTQSTTTQPVRTPPPTAPPTPPPQCTPSIPNTITYSDNTGSHTRPASSYTGNAGTWLITVNGPQGTRVNVSISGMVGCGGGLHHTLRVTDHSGNFSCNPTQGSAVSAGINTYGPPPDTVNVSVAYDNGCP